MARFAVAGSRSAAGVVSAGFLTDVVNASTTTADVATVNTDVGVLVADGASPTQAHVTTLNTDWTALKLDIAAGNLSASSTAVILSFDATAIGTQSKLRQVLACILKAIEGSGALNP